MHDVVALLEEVPAKHFSTGRPLVLHRGQIGTVVMIYPDRAGDGVRGPRRPGTIQPDRLMVLHGAPDYAAA
jgi:hypothetical protein